MSQTAKGEILTTDGIPLKVSLKRAERRNKIRALLLVLPLALFITVTFVIPIISMLTRSVDDKQINTVFPKTFKIYKQWDQKELPSEEMYATIFNEIMTADKRQVGKASTRMNYSKSGWKSLIKKSKRKFKKIKEGPYKEQMIATDKKWADMEYWKALGQMVDPITFGYYLNAVDLQYDSSKKIVRQPEKRRIYNYTWYKTIKISVLVTLFCLILGYPIAHLLATLPLKLSNLLMIFVLLPFWTSLLVRTVSWIVILMQNGIFNNILVWAGIVSDDNRIQLIYNETGTLIAMTQILLPFMVLPLYSVMKTIPPSYMRAALNLGAQPMHAFYRIYMPQTVPGISAGGLLVFVLAIGYFITPELVGGSDGQLIGHWIAYHLKSSLNWGLCSALGTILLVAMLVLYWVYNKIVGIENIKLG
ncbi:MAG: ABC transporter permease [Pelagibacteraceae bacterium]|jgi:putative spermidine/putrescine transport system permease protein|nr:ABC transporter permease [Pelagibacteraceae bacterium]